jgi:uncharacterized protein
MMRSMSRPDGHLDAGTTGSVLAAPVSPSERHQIIDIVRGFALFGVLALNLLWSARYATSDSAPTGAFVSGAFDDISMLLSELLISHKFYAIFSLLFGLGLAIQLERGRARDAPVLGTYARRVLVLFAIGAVHALLIWSGDVLHIYALLGFLLIVFSRCSNKALLGSVAVFFGLAVGVVVIQWGVIEKPATVNGTPVEEAVAIVEEVAPASGDGLESASPGDDTGHYARVKSGSWADIVAFNWAILVENYTQQGLGPGSNVYWYLTIFWKFLLGMYIGRSGLLQRSAELGRPFKWLCGVSLVLGIVGHGAMFMLMANFDMFVGRPARLLPLWAAVECGLLALGMFYVSGLVLWYRTRLGARLLGSLAPMGRMALTNYVMHSLIFIVLFYGVGFGLVGRVSHAGCLALSVLIFGVQIVLSAWWLTRFRFGPMEWLWRSLTYGRLQPLWRTP